MAQSSDFCATCRSNQVSGARWKKLVGWICIKCQKIEDEKKTKKKAGSKSRLK